MRKAALAIATIIIAATVALACPGSATCPFDGQAAYYTGTNKYSSGHTFGLFRCGNGDEFWVRCD